MAADETESIRFSEHVKCLFEFHSPFNLTVFCLSIIV